MSRFDWLSELIARLQDEHIILHKGSRTRLPPAHMLHIEREDWGRATQQCAKFGCRWSALWAEEFPKGTLPLPNVGGIENDLEDGFFIVSACLEKEGDYLVLRTAIPHAMPALASQTVYYPAANRAERHTQDLLGIVFYDHPDPRRWTRHQAWSATEYPLRKGFPSPPPTPTYQGGRKEITPPYQGGARGGISLTPPDSEYPFVQAQGTGVYEIPVGPVHAGIIEPGHFRFQAVGEMVLNLEQHLGYVHKGIEKLAEGRNAFGLAKLAGRVSGDSTIAHTWAACLAMERAAKIELPRRAVLLRALMAERERVANHLGDIGAIANDVAFAFAFSQCSRLREQWQRLNQASFGHRLLMDVVIPGGVCTDLPEEHIITHQQQLQSLLVELPEIAGILERHTGLEDRLATTGILTPKQASQLGCLGYVGRASGQKFDVRRDAPYAPYDQLSVTVPMLTSGDVQARLQVRLAEIYESVQLLEQLLEQLTTGEISVPWTVPVEQAEGLGVVEGWRGEVVAYVRFGIEGKINRYYPRDPSWLNWPALELLIRGNIVPDFPVCNKSVNGSYSGHDL
ncbi:MAG: hydrogenase [Beggiatoa sp. IS2]|nr:MAG: hydrogenase [Beggiatoa sp. IS2]